MLGGSVSRGGGAAQHLQNQIRTRFGCARFSSALGRAHWPLRHVSASVCVARSPTGAGLLAHRLFRRYDLIDRGPFSLCIIVLLIGLVQKLVDDACTPLLLDPGLLRFLLFGEEPVVYFPAH